MRRIVNFPELDGIIIGVVVIEHFAGPVFYCVAYQCSQMAAEDVFEACALGLHFVISALLVLSHDCVHVALPRAAHKSRRTALMLILAAPPVYVYFAVRIISPK